ncbi:hypothetical protein GCM10011380_31470 [Sphingomonas metalli]|uniref:Uncharacterized protein n=1 Tax=Sphingomonas metalli TaxID=1779358 RepID=A0A916TD95_9SPHN|nr:hypothetical protein [Sphingomonas metalli]GGB39660.1 hypothetical protein GCM10011380_31470 [Sphingomonas metalli]
MTRSVRDWLLECPQVRSVSSLAREACASGLLDLREASARAIARGIRTSAAGAVFGQPPGYHVRVARMLSCRRMALRLQLVRDTLVLSGSLGRGVGISGDRRSSYLHIRRAIPATLAIAMAGRSLAEIVDLRMLPLRGFTVGDVEHEEYGITIRFNVPRVDLAEALASADRPLSPATSAR